MNNHRLQRAIALLCLPTLLCGCAVGPDFVTPTTPVAAGYTLPVPLAASVPATAPDRVQPDAPSNIAAQWWSVFHAPVLDALIADAMRANPTIAAAEAGLRIAAENAAAQTGAFYPSVALGFNPTRQKSAAILSPPLASGAPVYNLHTAQVSVSYMVDVFGGNRRQLESLQAQADGQRYQLHAAQLTLTTNLVTAVIQFAALRDQIAATGATIAIATESLAIQRRQLALGAIAEANVIAQDAALAQVEALLPVLRKQLAQQHDLIAALTGRTPAELPEIRITLADLQLPTALPGVLPSALAHNRPDVRAAEEQLHAASAQVGVAIANLYPQIGLSAGKGGAAATIAGLVGSGAGFWSVGAALTQPLFQGGALLHRKRSAEAAYAQAAAQYRATVIGAFQNVADAMQAIGFDAEIENTAVRAEAATLHSLQITRRQVALGDLAYLSGLQAEQAWQQARINVIQARAGRLADSAALFQALGGGWNSTAN